MQGFIHVFPVLLRRSCLFFCSIQRELLLMPNNNNYATFYMFTCSSPWLIYLFPIWQVYLCEKFSLVNEMYFAITLDRSTAGPVRLQLCAKIFSSIISVFSMICYSYVVTPLIVVVRFILVVTWQLCMQD